MAPDQRFSNPESGGILSRIVETLVSAVRPTPGVLGRMEGRESQHRTPTGPPGGVPGRQTPASPPRHWANPSSTEGGRPWPPAPPHW